MIRYKMLTNSGLYFEICFSLFLLNFLKESVLKEYFSLGWMSYDLMHYFDQTTISKKQSYKIFPHFKRAKNKKNDSEHI